MTQQCIFLVFGIIGWWDPHGSPRVALGLVAQPIPNPSRVWVQNPARLPGVILAKRCSLCWNYCPNLHMSFAEGRKWYARRWTTVGDISEAGKDGDYSPAHGLVQKKKKKKKKDCWWNPASSTCCFKDCAQSFAPILIPTPSLTTSGSFITLVITCTTTPSGYNKCDLI